MNEVINGINWIDLLIITILIRIIYISIRSGLQVEFFKFLGTLCGLYFALHYYSFFGGFFSGHAKEHHLADLFSFVLLLFMGYAIFWLFRFLTAKFVSTEINPVLSKWGGFALGVGRWFLVSSLILVLFSISSVKYLKKSTNSSFSGSYMSLIAPHTYTVIWNGITSRFMSGEKFNSAVTDL